MCLCASDLTLHTNRHIIIINIFYSSKDSERNADTGGPNHKASEVNKNPIEN